MRRLNSKTWVGAGLCCGWILAAGCTYRTPIPYDANEVLDLRVRAAQAFDRCSIEPGSAMHVEIEQFLYESPADWQRSAATFRETKLIFASDFRLSFADDTAILEFSKGRFVRAVTPERHAFLTCSHDAD